MADGPPKPDRAGPRFFAVIAALNAIMFVAIAVMEFRAFSLARLNPPRIAADVAVVSDKDEELRAAATGLARRMFADGRVAYGKCALCHAIEEVEPNFGPHLACVDQRRIADNEHSPNADYRFSLALKRLSADEETWTLPLLTRFAANPESVRPDTRMPFPGLTADHGGEDAPTKTLRDVVQYLAWHCVGIADLTAVRVARLDNAGDCKARDPDALREIAELTPEALYSAFAEDPELYFWPRPLPECGE